MMLIEKFPQFLLEDVLNPMMNVGMIYVAMPLIEQVIKYATVYDTPTKLFFSAAFCSTLVPALVPSRVIRTNTRSKNINYIFRQREKPRI